MTKLTSLVLFLIVLLLTMFTVNAADVNNQSSDDVILSDSSADTNLDYSSANYNSTVNKKQAIEKKY